MAPPVLLLPTRFPPRSLWLPPLLLLLVALPGCVSPRPAALTGPAPASLTMAERRLQAILDREAGLRAEAAALETARRAEPGGEDRSARDSLEQRFGALAREYESYLADNPDHFEARLLYGKLLVTLGQHEMAIRQFLVVDQEHPTLPVVKQQIGNYLAETGRYMAALPYFLNAIDLAPDEPLYPYQLGLLLYQYRDFYLEDRFYDRAALDSQMLAAFRRAAELAPDERAYRQRYAEAFYDVETPDWEEALRQWESLAATARTRLESDAVRLHRARVLHRLGRTPEALRLAGEPVDPALEFSRSRLREELDSAGGLSNL